jgi:hypothetical protein
VQGGKRLVCRGGMYIESTWLNLKPSLSSLVLSRSGRPRQCTQSGRPCLPRLESIGLLTRARTRAYQRIRTPCRRSKKFPHPQVRAQVSGTAIEVGAPMRCGSRQKEQANLPVGRADAGSAPKHSATIALSAIPRRCPFKRLKFSDKKNF